MLDPTEALRQGLAAVINAFPLTREELTTLYGQVWDSAELARDFDVVGFLAPFVAVIRKSDNAMGTLEFQHHPRLYYDFRADE